MVGTSSRDGTHRGLWVDFLMSAVPLKPFEILSLKTFFFIYSCVEEKGGKEREGNIYPLPLAVCWSATQACALIGNRPGDFSFCGKMLNQLSHAFTATVEILICLFPKSLSPSRGRASTLVLWVRLVEWNGFLQLCPIWYSLAAFHFPAGQIAFAR